MKLGICKINKDEIRIPLGLNFRDSTIWKSYKHNTLLVIPHAGHGTPVNHSNRQKWGITSKTLMFTIINIDNIRMVLSKIFQFIWWIWLSEIFLIKKRGIILISIVYVNYTGFGVIECVCSNY